MINTGLIICPQCLEKQKKNVLGSVSPDGKLHILRTNQLDMTIVQSPSMMIICTCGFGTVVVENPSTITYTVQS